MVNVPWATHYASHGRNLANKEHPINKQFHAWSLITVSVYLTVVCCSHPPLATLFFVSPTKRDAELLGQPTHTSSQAA